MEIKETDTRKIIKKINETESRSFKRKKNMQTFSQNDQEIREKTQLTKLGNKKGVSLRTSQK